MTNHTDTHTDIQIIPAVSLHTDNPSIPPGIVHDDTHGDTQNVGHGDNHADCLVDSDSHGDSHTDIPTLSFMDIHGDTPHFDSVVNTHSDQAPNHTDGSVHIDKPKLPLSHSDHGDAPSSGFHTDIPAISHGDTHVDTPTIDHIDIHTDTPVIPEEDK